MKFEPVRAKPKHDLKNPLVALLVLSKQSCCVLVAVLDFGILHGLLRYFFIFLHFCHISTVRCGNHASIETT